MFPLEDYWSEIDFIIANALREDVGSGDHSSLACIPADAEGMAKLLVKEDCVIAGVAFAQRVLKKVDPESQLEIFIHDGNKVKVGDIVFKVKARSRSILKAERLLLNAMQRMSAIATKTADFTEVLKGTKTRVLDTRKTTPGIRVLEKWAVDIGGGTNHRFGLYDMIMLKDNHIDFCGGISSAIQQTKQYLQEHALDIKIIVEARNMDEIKEILSNEGVYRILIDNFTPEETRKAVELIGNRCLTESSGGITLENARSYADAGVDFISSGALTHSVNNVDLSLKAISE